MRLGTDGGARADLRIVDYQFPGNRDDGTGTDWDANWLLVTGDATADDGHTWSFLDPCLTTWEARDLGAWLRGVVDGSVRLAPPDAGETEGLLVFTEPNLAFSLADRGDGVVTVRVHLSLESRPPWLSGPGVGDFGDFLLTRTPVARLTRAAADWERMRAEHPAR